MSDVLSGTHPIVCFVFDTERRSPAADTVLTIAAQSGKLFISAIALVELNYLSGKKCLPFPRFSSARRAGDAVRPEGTRRRLVILGEDAESRVKTLGIVRWLLRADSAEKSRI